MNRLVDTRRLCAREEVRDAMFDLAAANEL